MLIVTMNRTSNLRWRKDEINDNFNKFKRTAGILGKPHRVSNAKLLT